MIESMPSYEGVSLEWALWYLSLGLLPLPIRSAAEVDEYMARAEAEHPEWTDKQFADAREAAEKRPKIVWRDGLYCKRGVSEADVREWFEAHPDRRIYLLTGVGSGLCVVDVDTYKGGDPAPWRVSIDGVACTAVVRTPQGGLHFWFAERDGYKTTTQKLEGIDARGKGGGVAAPSGRSTPGRTFELFGWPLAPLPDAAMQIGRRRAPTSPIATSSPMTASGAPRLLLAAPEQTDNFAHVVSTERPDGTKHQSVATIVGMLCRRQPLPDDAIAASLRLLDEWAKGWAGVAMVRVGWEDALRSAAGRSEQFVVEFVSLWNALRCRPPWPDDGEKSARVIAASMWRTADAGEREAAEVVEGRRLPPAEPVPSARLMMAPPTRVADEGSAPFDPSEGFGSDEGPEGDAVAEADGAGEAEPHESVGWLHQFAHNSARDWTADDVDADASRELIACDVLPPWLGPDGFADRTCPHGHGWGPWMNEAIGGGLAPGFLYVLVARRAKGGKTAFVDQHLAGVLMLGAQNYLNGSGPIPLVWVVTEMTFADMERRGAARYVGFDQGMFRLGRRAELARGVRDTARREKSSAHDVAQRYWDRTKAKLGSRDLWAIGRQLRWTIKVDELPEDSRTGPELVSVLGQLVDVSLVETARAWRVDPARIVPYVLFDPVQRHQGSAKSMEDALPGDRMISAIRRSTNTRHWITAVTSDTNQASARAGATDTSKTPDAIVAQACRGTYSVLHEADMVCALDVLPLSQAERQLQIGENRDLELTANMWVGLSRFGERTDHALPFRYFPRTGRFVAQDPHPPPPPAPVPIPPDPNADPTAHQDPPPVQAAVAPVRLVLAPPRGRGAKKPP